MDICLIFTVANKAKAVADLGKSIAQFFDVVDSLEAKIDRLIGSSLASGLRNLALVRDSEGERVELLREARACFNIAVPLYNRLRRWVYSGSLKTLFELLRTSDKTCFWHESSW